MNQYVCFNIMSREITAREPIKYCVLGDKKVYIGLTLQETKQKALFENSEASFLDNCGWVFEGEEEEILKESNFEILVDGIKKANDKRAGI